LRRRIRSRPARIALVRAVVGILDGKPTLQGSKAGRSSASAIFRAITRRLQARPSAVTYSIIEEMVERRREGRRPARLQSGKILDADERFLTEFIFRDRSEKGVRLRLAQRVALPRSVLLFDDQNGRLFIATVVWQHGSDAGCRVSREWATSPETLLSRLRNPYYAVR
jgi:hypothetical protein